MDQWMEDEQTEGWLDGIMHGWIEGCLDGCMDGCDCVCVKFQVSPVSFENQNAHL